MEPVSLDLPHLQITGESRASARTTTYSPHGLLQPTILFDMRVDGEPVKGRWRKRTRTAWLYILNRETGEPVHPIIEMPVPTETDREGEQPLADPADSPQGQRRAHGAGGVAIAGPGTNIPPESLEGRVLVPQGHPVWLPNQIRAELGGASYGPICL